MVTDTELIRSKSRFFLQRSGIYSYMDEVKVEKNFKKTFLVIFAAFDCIGAVFLNLGMENYSNSTPLS